jgi:hypothetical protein
MSDDKPDDQLPEKEVTERMDKALRRSFTMPHKPHKPRGRKPAARKAAQKKGR